MFICFSEKLNRFYIGTTDDFENRLFEHNYTTDEYSYTYRGRPWVKHLVLDNLSSIQAYKIEKHLKGMKSSKYLVNLTKYPELLGKLKLL